MSEIRTQKVRNPDGSEQEIKVKVISRATPKGSKPKPAKPEVKKPE